MSSGTSKKKALKISSKMGVLLAKKAAEQSLDVESFLHGLLGMEAEATESDDEVVRRLRVLAEESRRLPAYPCRWFTRMPEFE